MSKKILVTGATGFIGRHTLQPLADAGFEISCTIRSTSKSIIRSTEVPVNTEFILSDILDPNQIKDTLKYCKPEYLLHLAWDVNPGYRDNLYNVDLMNSSLNLIHQFANYGGRKATIAGTCYDWPTHTLYGTCKRSLWNILTYARYTESLELNYGRIYYLYGPHELKTRLVPTIINGLLDNQIVKINSMGEQAMYLSYVQDVADALVQAIERDDVRGEFDILGTKTNIRQITSTITELLDKPENSVTFGSSYEETREPYLPYNTTKLGELPTTSLTRGLVKTISWWELQRLNKEGL